MANTGRADVEEPEDELEEPEAGNEKRVGNNFIVNDSGVWWEGANSNTLVCYPRIEIEAVTKNVNGDAWGKILSFVNKSGTVKKYHLLNSKLISGSSKILADLTDSGLDVFSKSKTVTFLLELYSANHLLSSPQPGWVEKNFVLPDESFGNDECALVTEGKTHIFNQSGTFQQWKDKVASLCVGNPYLMFGASVGFAAPLLRIVGIGCSGFHICGMSQRGKSTSLQLAASILGDPSEGSRNGYVSQWDSTKAAMEIVADSLNDCLFACDEIGQVESAILGKTLYMIGTGVGKDRMGQKKKRTWRIMMLTTGEKSISEIMAEVDQKTMQGQEVRILQIGHPKHTEFLHEFHGQANGSDFALHIKRMTSEYHGTAFRQWLKVVVPNRDAIAHQAHLIMERFKAEVMVNTLKGGIAPSAAQRFGLVAAAGELATTFNMTGWKKGDAYKAAVDMFNQWKEHLATFDPTVKAIQNVRNFITEYETKFVDADSDKTSTVGYKKKNMFLIFPDVFKDVVCNGNESLFTAQQLEKAGFLIRSGKNLTKTERIKGDVVNMFAIKDTIKVA